MFGYFKAKIGAHLWETNGFWIDKEKGICQEDYSKLPVLGKIGYRLMVKGLKEEGITTESLLNARD